MTIEHFAPQGTEAWKKARAGVITASHFKTICEKVNVLTDQQAAYVTAILSGASQANAMAVAGYKAKPSSCTVERALAGEKVGEFSDIAKNYAFRLAIERISGEPLDEGYMGWAAERGHELEPLARAAHQIRILQVVREVGFVTTDDGWFGASADGMRDDVRRGCEYKCFLAPDKLRPILFENDISEVAHQCLGGMWITGMVGWDFGLYCPALAPAGRDFTLIDIPRDDNVIDDMAETLMEFRGLVMSYEARLRAGEAGRPAPAAASPVPAPTTPTPTRTGVTPVALPENLFAA